MLKIFKVIFSIFVFLIIPMEKAISQEKKDIDSRVDNTLIPPKNLVDNLNKNRFNAEKEYDIAIDLFQKGKIDDSLDILLRLNNMGHPGAQTTLAAIKKQKPSLVKAAYNRAEAKKTITSQQTDNDKPHSKTKEISSAQQKTITSDKPSDEQNKSQTLSYSASDTELKPEEKEEKPKEKKQNKETKISRKEKKKKEKQQKQFIEDYTMHYHAPGNVNSAFKMRNRDTVNGLMENLNNGNYQAAYTLGLLAQDGVMVEKDMNAASAYFIKACKHDIARACNNAGHIQRFGLDGSANLVKAEDLLTQAALAGDKYAVYNLASFYFYDGHIDNIKAYLYSEIAINMFNDKEFHAAAKRMKKINKKALEKMTFFQREYINVYYPKALASLLSAEYKKGKIWAEPVSMPQNNGTGMVKIKKIQPLDKPSKKTKKTFLIWRYPISPRNNAAVIRNFSEPPALSPNSPEAVYGMMYRYDIPYQMDFALIDRYSTIVARKGDKILINVWGTIMANGSSIADEKNTNIREKTTGTAVTQATMKRIPVPKNENFNDWMGYLYEAIAPGISEIIFERTDGEKQIVKIEVK